MAGPMSLAASLLLAFFALSASQDASPVPPSPFTRLEGVPGVSFSNDRYAVSLHWPPDAYVLTLPGLPSHRSGASVAGTELRIGCRASNGRPGYGVAPARAVLEVQRHPAARDAYNVLHPMFWILGLTGNGVDRTRVQVSLTGVSAPLAAVLEVSYVYDLGGRPPMRIGDLPARHLLSLIASSRPLVVEAEGAGYLPLGPFHARPAPCPGCRGAARPLPAGLIAIPALAFRVPRSGRRPESQRRPTTLNPTP